MINSLNLSVILFTVFLSACAQVLLKLGVSNQRADASVDGIKGIFYLLFTPGVFLGLTVYGISVFIWLWVLSRVELSLAYPFVGLSFIFTLAFGYFFLSESINAFRLIGTLLIAVGCVFVARS